MSPVRNLSQRSRSRLAYSLAALVASVALGTAGFCVIEGWSFADGLYMTLMTTTTVGYGPPAPLSPAGRNFAIFFMVVGVGTVAYAFSSAVQALVQSEIVAAFDKRRRRREMSRMHDHYIVCGAGRVGARVVSELQRAGVAFVAVERDPARAADLDVPETHVLVRDATLDETLREAGVARARGLVACLADDADNLYVVLSARTLNRDLHIVARAVEESAEPKLIKAGATRVVAPTIIGSHRMATALLRPAVADFMDSIAAADLDLGFEQVEVEEGSELAGRKLRYTPILEELDTVVVAIRRKGGPMLFNPSGDTRIDAGDTLIPIGRAESLAAINRMAKAGPKDSSRPEAQSPKGEPPS